MLFIPPFACSSKPPSQQQLSRRRILRFALAAAASTSLHFHCKEALAKEWDPEELCKDCRGTGKQTCSICDGTGVFSTDDMVVMQDNVCPNCFGKGTIRCLSCIGLGLADVNGILRNGKFHLHVLKFKYHLRLTAELLTNIMRR